MMLRKDWTDSYESLEPTHEAIREPARRGIEHRASAYLDDLRALDRAESESYSRMGVQTCRTN